MSRMFFLQIAVDVTETGTLTGRYINKDGKTLFEHTIPLIELQQGD